MFASRALEVFKQKRAELMLVIDEFGSLQGLLTLNDIIEEIVGDIEVEQQATQRQDGSWLLDGLLPVDDFKEIFKVDQLPHETEYESLSGFVMMSLGRVPQATDHFEWNGLRFEVMDMDGRRVDKVLVTTLPARSPTQPDRRTEELGRTGSRRRRVRGHGPESAFRGLEVRVEYNFLTP